MLYFGILHRVYISVAHNYLFACVHTVLLFWIKYAIACLPYFLQSFCSPLHCFFLLSYSHLHCLFFCRFLPVPLPRSQHIFVILACFFLPFRIMMLISVWNIVRIAFALFLLLVFLTPFVLVFLLYKWAVYINFVLARFRVFGGCCLFFRFAFTYAHSYHTARLLIPLHSSPSFSLTTQTILANFLTFLAVISHYKNASCSPTLGDFCLVFASLFAHAFIRTHRTRSIPICTHFHHFLSN